MASYTMRDPTAETAAVLRERRPAASECLAGKRVALLSISKERSDEFMDALEPHDPRLPASRPSASKSRRTPNLRQRPCSRISSSRLIW